MDKHPLLSLVVTRLFSVKSLVTIALTAVFAYLAVTNSISGQEFLTIFTVIISFYFGTQASKESSTTTTTSTYVSEGEEVKSDDQQPISDGPETGRPGEL